MMRISWSPVLPFITSAADPDSDCLQAIEEDTIINFPDLQFYHVLPGCLEGHGIKAVDGEYYPQVPDFLRELWFEVSENIGVGP